MEVYGMKASIKLDATDNKITAMELVYDVPESVSQKMLLK